MHLLTFRLVYIHNIHHPRSYIDSHPSFISHMLLLYTTYFIAYTQKSQAEKERVGHQVRTAVAKVKVNIKVKMFPSASLIWGYRLWLK